MAAAEDTAASTNGTRDVEEHTFTEASLENTQTTKGAIAVLE